MVPAQHYTCGGILIDLAASTDLPGLWAAGECTEAGLHGANRLPRTACSNASCSAKRRPATSCELRRYARGPPEIRDWDESRVTDSDEEVVIAQNWTEIRRFMWNYVGIVRTTKRLERAAHRMTSTPEVRRLLRPLPRDPDLIELRNLVELRT